MAFTLRLLHMLHVQIKRVKAGVILQFLQVRYGQAMLLKDDEAEARNSIRLRFICTVESPRASPRTDCVSGNWQLFPFVRPTARILTKSSHKRCAILSGASRRPIPLIHSRKIAAS